MIRLIASLALLGAAPMPAAAPGPLTHPLGNFSINEYVGLTMRTDRVDAVTIVDAAEIPTLQDRSTVDSNGDGTTSPAELSAHGQAACRAVAAAVPTAVDGHGLVWTVASSWFAYTPGAGGLDVSRLQCQLSAPATVTAGSSLRVDNRYLVDRVGWRELTAAGQGVALDSPVPATSVSNELRDYPKDLLSSALNVRSATIAITTGGAGRSAASGPLIGGDPVSRWLAGLDRTFSDLVGQRRLTPQLGLLAVLLAMLLGAGHAALPGHGKTILAAYLAGKRGRRRDALAVAGTVTATHTGGVLALGLLLSAGTALAGDRVLGWLGLVSGTIVVGVGASMLLAAARRRRLDADHHDHSHDNHGHGHGHHHGDHDHAHPHDHAAEHGHSHHGTDSDHPHPRRRSRWGLAGIGLAGGLVPSPSALVVLLAAIGLGRTGYGVVLVVAYGAGMAATLTGAGLLLLALQRRLARSATGGRLPARLARLTGRINAATPAATATLVLLVGAGLTLRAAVGVL